MELAYEGRSEPLEFSPPEQRQRVLLLRNASDVAVLFKVQCTAPRKLRVRPALGILAAAETASIQVHLSPQECTAATCKLLVLGRIATQTLPLRAAAVDAEQLKTMWTATEAQTDPDTLVLSETVNVRIRSASAAATGDDKAATLSSTPSAPPQLTTRHVAELVLLLMKSQSRRKENALATAERERLLAAKELHPSDWPCWEEYAVRMRKLLQERHKRKIPV
ncbi:uncharacterized protein KRP23_115 [Phytophthora ramorum]|uniref:MSP domain-containing protein n=1 Tax=Phytophthora ramorum TaxID=164328 RepID=H3GYI1_PHYRM|nr:hypothetical protein KRP23_115 [Phytophthora ramorum]